MSLYRLLLSIITIAVFHISCVAQNTGYHILKKYHLDGDGKWDYMTLSPVSNNMYVAHATQVNIIDRTTGKSKGVIKNTTGVHGIALVPQTGKGYTSNGKLNTLTIFDIETNKVKGTINVGKNPDAIMFDPFSKLLFVCNGTSKDMSVVDPATDKVIKTIALGGKPETAVSDEAGNLFVNNEDLNELIVLDTKSLTIKHRYKIGKGEEPSGLAIDRGTKRLFIGCGNKVLVVMDALTGKIVTELPIGDKCDGIGFDKSLKQIYSSNGEGTLTIIKEQNADEYKVLENVPTKKGAKTIAVDEKTHWVYLSAADISGVDPDGRWVIVPGTFEVLVVGK